MKYATTKDIEQLYAHATTHGLSTLAMTELGGWAMTMLMRKLDIPSTKKILVACGNERKGAYGLAAAHHLLNHRRNVAIVLTHRDIPDDTRYYLEIIKKIGAPVLYYDEEQAQSEELLNAGHIIIDALVGPDAAKTRDPITNTLISFLARGKRTIFSFEVPSGLDGSTGISFPPNLSAHATLALGMPTQAFLSKEGPLLSGQTFVGDIGIPKFIYDKISLGSRPKFDAYPDCLLPLKEYNE